MPTHIRMRLRDANDRQIRQGANLERQSGEYAKNQLELQKRGMLLPRLMQTGGTSSGYNTQVYQQPSIWGSVIQGAATVGAAMLSDERVKNIRGQSPVGLEQVAQLQPTSYQYKPEAGMDEGREHQGLVAQNVEQVMPEAVVEDPQGLKGVDQEAVVAALVNAVKELNQKVDALSGSQPAQMPHRPMGGGMNYGV